MFNMAQELIISGGDILISLLIMLVIYFCSYYFLSKHCKDETHKTLKWAIACSFLNTSFIFMYYILFLFMYPLRYALFNYIEILFYLLILFNLGSIILAAIALIKSEKKMLALICLITYGVTILIPLFFVLVFV